jgi:hypothetical protein
LPEEIKLKNELCTWPGKHPLADDGRRRNEHRKKHSVGPVERAGTPDAAVRNWIHNPKKILPPYRDEGMIVRVEPAIRFSRTIVIKNTGGAMTWRSACEARGLPGSQLRHPGSGPEVQGSG